MTSYSPVQFPKVGQLCYCQITPFENQPSTFLVVKILSIKKVGVMGEYRAEINFSGDGTCYWVDNSNLYIVD